MKDKSFKQLKGSLTSLPQREVFIKEAKDNIARGGEIPPLVYGMDRNSMVVGSSLAYENDVEKEKILLMIKCTFSALGVNDYIGITEAWIARESVKYPASIPPSQRPDKQECLIVFGGNFKERFMHVIPFFRKTKGKVTFMKTINTSFKGDAIKSRGGVFLNMLDKNFVPPDCFIKFLSKKYKKLVNNI